MINPSRRQFLQASAACALSLGACQSTPQPQRIDAQQAPSPELQREWALAQAAIRAANSHNTQPWRLQLAPGRIVIRPDFSRRCPEVDPLEHHLWLSIGCAVENIVQAAPQQGRVAQVEARDQGQGPAVYIDLKRSTATEHPLAAAIAQRQCTRSEYSGRPLASSTLEALLRAGSSAHVAATPILDPALRQSISEITLAANQQQMRSSAFLAELRHWLRFNATSAQAQGDGLYVACSGNPEWPDWLGPRLFDWFYSVEAAQETLAKQLRSASGLILLHSAGADWAQWVDIGRATQRLSLQATALGCKIAFANQAVEVAALRPQLTAALGLPERQADILLRFGEAPNRPRSYRRPLAAVVEMTAPA